MESGENKGGAAASSTVAENERSSSMRMVETALRLVAVALCVAALFVMLRNSQTNDFGSVSYAHLTAFRYLVHANGICAGYSLLSAIVAFAPRPSTMSRACTFFLLDQVLTYIVLAAGAASTEVLYLAYKGDTSIAWGEACESFAGFCHRATTSVVITFAGVACYAALSLVSSYRLFSKFDAPLDGFSDMKHVEIATFQG